MNTVTKIDSSAQAQRKKLALAYNVLALLGLDDHTYTHLSVRAGDTNNFYMCPFGLNFEEVTADNLIEVSPDGAILSGRESICNDTGYIIHGAVYQARPDINAVFHIHTPEIVAVSACERGLLPISQWALHFHDRVSYHPYDSLALENTEGKRMAQNLGSNNTMLLRNHGSLTCGRTVEETMFYTYHLQKACETQCLALAMNHPLCLPDDKTSEKAVRDLLSFEKDLGRRDWDAWVRRLDSRKPA